MSYKGLCVGGARAGEWVSSDTSSFIAYPFCGRQMLGDGTFIILEGGFEMPEDWTYRYAVADGFCAFWVPLGKDENWAVRELVRCYRRKELALGDQPELE
jgi:hypothetical protein